ncbi:MAG: transglycosylase family protein [Thermoleophilia bacterium]
MTCAAGAGLIVLGDAAGSPAGGTTVDAQRARVRELESNLSQVGGQQQQAADAYRSADARVHTLVGQIADNTRQQRDVAGSLAGSRAALAHRLAEIYAQGTPNLMDMVLSSGSLTSAIDSYELVKRAADGDAALIGRMRAAQATLTRLRGQLVRDHRVALRSKAEAGARLSELRSLVEQRRRLLVAAQSSLASAQRAAVRLAASRAAVAARPTATPAQVLTASGGSPPADATQSTASPTPVSAPAGGTAAAVAHLASIAQCESGGNPRAVSPSGQYRGKYQFSIATWQAIGGSGDPIDAPEAEQDRLALKLYLTAGPGQWPVCSLR